MTELLFKKLNILIDELNTSNSNLNKEKIYLVHPIHLRKLK